MFNLEKYIFNSVVLSGCLQMGFSISMQALKVQLGLVEIVCRFRHFDFRCCCCFQSDNLSSCLVVIAMTVVGSYFLRIECSAVGSLEEEKSFELVVQPVKKPSSVLVDR